MVKYFVHLPYFFFTFIHLDNFSHHIGCGGTYLLEKNSPAVTMEIKTPNFPQMYPRNSQCEWTLKVPANHIIEFHVTSINMTNKDCINDHVDVFDPDVVAITRFCGNETGSSYLSTSNVLKVIFRSGGGEVPTGYQYYGLRATWKIGMEFNQ